MFASSRFQILNRLGEGGMGVVYEALDRERGSRVALKTLRSLTPDTLARFKREFRALLDIHHPNLVSLGELISEGDQWFFTMELVDGVDFLAYVRPWPDLAKVDELRAEATTRSRPTPHDPSPRPASTSRTSGPVGVTDPTLPSGVIAVAAPATSVAPGFDDARLRASLVQLALGMNALHESGKVHRDIKPSNIRIASADGRVVLLDFGLVGDTMSERASDAAVAGTPAYMAPEQASTGNVGPEADWYSVGVVLYEALTGRLPFEGSALEVLMRKQDEEPLPPNEIVRDVPTDLERLCLDLLKREPCERPTGAQVLHRLHALPRSTPLRAKSQGAPPFVGRAQELGELARAFDACGKSAVAVVAFGESGVGKSCLVRAFLDHLHDEHPDVVILHGRCHEREAVPYKALDGVVDALSRRLARLPDDAAASLLPVWATALTHVFPVLRRAKVFARESQERPDIPDPHELRRRAFDALRELLTRLAMRHRTVVVVDDLQWADADSLALLAELLRPPQAPPLLLVATVRTHAREAGSAPELPAKLLAAIPGDVRTLHVPRLPRAEAHELARLLMARLGPSTISSSPSPRRGQSSPPTRAAVIADDAEGHPLFIDELVRHAALSSGEMPGLLKLDEALWARVSGLPPEGRRIVELVAVAAAPLTQELVAHAASMDLGEFARVITPLRAENLVRTGGSRGSDLVEPYHDRVREAVLSHLDETARRACHELLAVALEGTKAADLEALAVHWRGAGNDARAEKYAVAAAEQASNALAFDRAADWYATALELHKSPDGQRRQLRARLADALAYAGRGALAAAEYQAAAEGANAAEAIPLRRRAMEELLKSGQFDRGLEQTQEVLAAVGMRMPATSFRALLALLWMRLYLWMRGLGFRERDASQIPGAELTRIDACYSLGVGLSITDHVFGALFNTRTLILSLRAGEPYRIARSLALEIGFSGGRGSKTWPHTEALIRRTTAIAERFDDPYLNALVTAVSATAHYLSGHFRRSLELSDRAQEMLRRGVRGGAWENATMQLFGQNSLFFLGEILELSARNPRYLREARERGDLFAAVNRRIGYANMSWLAADDPDAARTNAIEAMETWSKRGFHIEHFYEVLARANIELYAGDAAAATAFVETRVRAYERSMLQRLQLVRIAMWQLRARCALAAAAAHVAGSKARGAGLDAAELFARKIAAEQMPWSSPMAPLVDASVAYLRGDRAGAVERARDAMMRFESEDMRLYAAVAKRVLGGLVGGDKGRALADEAEAWMRGQGIANAARMTRMLAPGFER